VVAVAPKAGAVCQPNWKVLVGAVIGAGPQAEAANNPGPAVEPVVDADAGAVPMGAVVAGAMGATGVPNWKGKDWLALQTAQVLRWHLQQKQQPG
jgi:hypothetical protein